MVANAEFIMASAALNQHAVPPNAGRKQTADYDFASLHALNLSFLKLLQAEAQTVSAVPLPQAMRPLTRLTPAALLRLSQCPYALFDLRPVFIAAQFIGAHCDAECASMSAASFGAPCASALRVQFASTALFYAWHVLRAAPFRARLLFGLEFDAAHQLLALPIHALTTLAFERAAHLAPRCHRHASFWSELLRHAESEDSQQLRASQWLGRQLLAAQR
jgi:hypothetical protein